MLWAAAPDPSAASPTGCLWKKTQMNTSECLYRKLGGGIWPTILFYVVIGIVVSTSGCYLKNKTQRIRKHTVSVSEFVRRIYTYRDDSGVIGQEISWGHVSSLIFCTSHVKRELNRTLRTEIITCAVLMGNRRQQNVTFHFSTIKVIIHIHADATAFNTLTREYCILSTMSSLVSGINPIKDEHGNFDRSYLAL